MINLNQENNNLIVTAYYKIKNKRESNLFIDWIKNFFFLKSFKVVYTNRDTLENVFMNLYKNIVKFNNQNDKYIDISINSLFVIQELEDTFIWKNYKHLMDFSEKKDVEILKGINHNKYLYTIWNNKTFWLKETSEFIHSKSYYWVDIGCIRYPSTKNVQLFVSSLDFVNRKNTKIIFSIIDEFKNDEFYVNSIPYIYYNNGEVTRIQGGFFGGGKNELIEFSNLYIDELNLFEKFKVFAGKDQYIMGSIYLKYKYKFDIFIPKNESYNERYCDDIWFRFLKLFG
jgi:hypothetical protein